MRQVLLSFFILNTTGAGLLADEAPTGLPIVVYDYPPAITNAATTPQGHYIDQIKGITGQAELNIEWLRVSMDEEGRMLDMNQRPFCTTGRIYTESRGDTWAFLPHIFAYMEPDVVVAQKERATDVSRFGSSDLLLQSSHLKGVFVRGGFYGQSLDRLIGLEPSHLLTIGQSDSQVLALVASGRADYTIVPKGIWDSLKNSPEYLGKLISVETHHTYPVTDITPIYLVCSRQVSLKVLQRLEQAMESLGYDLPKSPIKSYVQRKEG